MDHGPKLAYFPRYDPDKEHRNTRVLNREGDAPRRPGNTPALSQKRPISCFLLRLQSSSLLRSTSKIRTNTPSKAADSKLAQLTAFSLRYPPNTLLHQGLD